MSCRRLVRRSYTVTSIQYCQATQVFCCVVMSDLKAERFSIKTKTSPDCVFLSSFTQTVWVTLKPHHSSSSRTMDACAALLYSSCVVSVYMETVVYRRETKKVNSTTTTTTAAQRAPHWLSAFKLLPSPRIRIREHMKHQDSLRCYRNSFQGACMRAATAMCESGFTGEGLNRGGWNRCKIHFLVQLCSLAHHRNKTVVSV